MEGRLKNTNYVVIIVTAAGKETQSCVVVTGGRRVLLCMYESWYNMDDFIQCIFVCAAGKHQCRALAETMYSPCEGLKEINHQLSTGVAQELIHFCNSLGQGDNDSPPSD